MTRGKTMTTKGKNDNKGTNNDIVGEEQQRQLGGTRKEKNWDDEEEQ